MNPHDIAWWYLWSDRVPAEAASRPLTRRLPPNFETPEMLEQRRKPRLQRSFQETAAASFGPVPFTGPEVPGKWLEFLDLYIKLQRRWTATSGSVLRTLHSRPEVEANTVIVFTSDHGEYGASHGLRGKGASAYEEALRVPLIVKDHARSPHRRHRPDAHPADLERGRGADAADDRHRVLGLAPGEALRAPGQTARPGRSC